MSCHDERSLFLDEVADVRPIRHDRIPLTGAKLAPTEAQLARRHAASAEWQTADHLTMEPITLCDPHDLVGFKRDGVQEGVYKKLRLGKYPLQASLDLHQKTLNEARQAVVHFIRDCEQQDLRCLLIRHGKGERSTPRALLKSYVSAWLPHLPAVMAMHSAEPRHGGSGALYVLLRKSERNKAENRERQQKRLG
ncbi:DNA endonuclease SmrA [Aeromonas cavernicola]|uniref:DNA endonuclease SmrA n=1 Tax=Aeromonas cavernicola TaxID=1006623 RepID=A0A2H9U1R5_9GAMM|nr:DNA endonuclease SmrA [Aeromonas cavernicola]PJG57971.1 DNA endonuclease SmrA [Aeromonas cavernicola]